MPQFIRSALAGLALFGALAPPLAQASNFELSGAWSSDGSLCGHVFTKKGNEVGFAELSDLYGSGFVINGNQIRGKSAQCTITSRKQDGDNLELSAACATAIMHQDVRFKLKVVNDNQLTRLFPDIPGMTLSYTRCKL
jgi:hypothetical protein